MKEQSQYYYLTEGKLKKRSTSREQTVLEVETQKIDDRFGDEPM